MPELRLRRHRMSTYRIVRFYADDSHPDHKKEIATGLTLEEAQEHCQSPATEGRDINGKTEWFDGYYLETGDG